MSGMDSLKWHAKAWGTLVGRAALYPARPPLVRHSMMDADRQLAGKYLETVRADVFAEGCDDSSTISIAATETRAHNCSIFELVTLAAIARHVRPSRVLEIGTYDGRSALAIAMNAGTDTEVMTMNLPPDHVASTGTTNTDEVLSAKVTSGERFVSHRDGQAIRQIFANSTTFDFSTVGRCQMIFIDGAHDTASAQSDTDNALAIVDRQNGIVAWHDATSYGVRAVTRGLVDRGFPLRLIAGTDIGVLRFRDGRPVDLMEAAA